MDKENAMLRRKSNTPASSSANQLSGGGKPAAKPASPASPAAPAALDRAFPASPVTLCNLALEAAMAEERSAAVNADKAKATLRHHLMHLKDLTQLLEEHEQRESAALAPAADLEDQLVSDTLEAYALARGMAEVQQRNEERIAGTMATENASPQLSGAKAMKTAASPTAAAPAAPAGASPAGDGDVTAALEEELISATLDASSVLAAAAAPGNVSDALREQLEALVMKAVLEAQEMEEGADYMRFMTQSGAAISYRQPCAVPHKLLEGLFKIADHHEVFTVMTGCLYEGVTFSQGRKATPALVDVVLRVLQEMVGSMRAGLPEINVDRILYGP
ncbi:hypothetical protein T484DRAFT_1899514 [Baffinella frigidus]|nr:hypothetical protein T484DRAFT_1899514 [Cryptophyta sp. CCMP2293]